MTHMQREKTREDKAQKYFEAWAGVFPDLDRDIEFLQELKFNRPKDLVLHIYNVFLFAMFYKCIEGDLLLPNTTDEKDDYNSAEPMHTDPREWLAFYQDDNSNYFKHISDDNDDYIIMHSGLFRDSNDIYCLFKQNKINNKYPPYKLVAIGNNQGCLYYSKINRNKAEYIFNKCKECKPLIHFNDVSDVIFDCTKLPNWNNPVEIFINQNHLQIDHKERVNKLGSGNIKKGIQSVKLMCVEACKRSITNYRYAYPYLYFDDLRGRIIRGFLLPLTDTDSGEVVLVASVMKEERDRGKSYQYRIRTCLKPEMAIEQARRVSSVEVDWMSKLLYCLDI